MIDPSVPTEHLEAAAAELDQAHRENLKRLVMTAGPALMAFLGFTAVRKQRREVRAELASRAEQVSLDAEETSTETHLARALDVIREALPEWAHLSEIDGHVVVVENKTGRLICSVLDPTGLAANVDRLLELMEKIHPTVGDG